MADSPQFVPMAGAGFCLESNPTSPIKSGFLDCEEIKDGLHKFGLIIPDDQLGILLNAVGATGNDNGDALADNLCRCDTV